MLPKEFNAKQAWVEDGQYILMLPKKQVKTQEANKPAEKTTVNQSHAKTAVKGKKGTKNVNAEKHEQRADEVERETNYAEMWTAQLIGFFRFDVHISHFQILVLAFEIKKMNFIRIIIIRQHNIQNRTFFLTG